MMKISRSISSGRAVAVLLFTWAGMAFSTAEPLIHSGETIAFMGDSITQQGAQSSSGYVRLVESGLKTNGIEVKVIPAGISGHKSNQMLSRLQRDVLDKNPSWMTLSCGVNDVWHGERGVPLDEYKVNITEIVDRCQEAGVKVMLLTATPIMEKDNDKNQQLVSYNDFLRELAKERNLPLADLSADFWEELNTPTMPRASGHYLTSDGVHMNPLGNMIMATGILKAFQLDASELAKAREAWQSAETRVQTACNITLAEYMKLNALAVQENKSVGSLLSSWLVEDIDEKLER